MCGGQKIDLVFFPSCGIPRIKLKSPGLMASVFLPREPAAGPKPNFFFFKFLYADVLSHHVVPGALRNPKSASDPLELQSETAVNHHVGAEKPAWVLSASV